MPAQPDLDLPRLSGVGVHREEYWYIYTETERDPLIVPSHYHVRWDDKEITDTDKLQLILHGPYDYTGYAYILHASCCSLLEEYFYPGPIPVARLVEVCKSCPLLNSAWSGMCLSWGHDYGGEVALDNLYPWEEKDFHLSGRYGRSIEDLEYREADPCRLLDLRELIQGANPAELKQQSHKIIEQTQSRQTPRTGQAAMVNDMVPNCFTGLPYEILGTVATFLPTADVRTFAQASKGLKIIIPSELGQSFWASRFIFEFDFVFEARKHQGNLDWRWLYFEIVNALHHSMSLQNRRRIWHLIQSPLSELLSLHWSGNQSLLPSNQNINKLRWKEVHGQFTQEKFYFGISCRGFYKQRTSIPTTLQKIIVSSILIGDMTYIAGIRFIHGQGQRVCLGYEGKLSANVMDQSIDITGIQGFILAIGSRGINALQFVTYGGRLSQWFGSPEGLPKTRRLITFKSIIALEAGFDGFKMTSLAIAEPSPASHGSSTGEESLLENAIWFPDIPESSLRWNESCFTATEDLTTGFRPLCYVLFKDITRVTAFWSIGGLLAIDFQDVAGNVRRLGPHSLDFRDHSKAHFHLNSREGEKVIRIDIHKKERFNSVEIFTNRGRQQLLGVCEAWSPTLKKMTVASRTSPEGISVPVGLYAQWGTNRREGLNHLCVISKCVPGRLPRPETFQPRELNLT